MDIDKIFLAVLFKKNKMTDLEQFYQLLSQLHSGQPLREVLTQHQELCPPDFLDEVLKLKPHIERRLDFLQNQGACLSYPFSPDYPDYFYNLADFPWIISYQGRVCWRQRTLSVVGARKINPWSKLWIRSELYDFAKSHKSVVVSGGAEGVDQEAHLVSLRAGLPTIAVLPSGLGVSYPDSFAKLRDEILELGGCLMSEHIFEQGMRKYYFVKRNRLIAALSRKTLIVQAGLRSGTMLTAKSCLEQSKDIGAVPGHPADLAFSGNLELIASGATPIRDCQDLGVFYGDGH